MMSTFTHRFSIAGALLALLLMAFPVSSLATPAGAGDVEIEGPITAIGDSSFTVAAFAFEVTEETVIEDAEGEPLAFADLIVGTVVEVEGTETDAALVAYLVRVVEEDGDGDGDGEDGDDGEDEEEEIEIEGVIEALGDSTLTVAALTFEITPETTFEGEDDAEITFADLALGMTVEVEGSVDMGAFVAAEVEVEAAEDEGDEVEAEGPITELGAASLTVDGVTFAVTDDTEIEGEDDAVLTFADLALGLIVEVEGVVGADGPVAEEIQVEDLEGGEDEGDDEEVEVTGSVEVLGEADLTVAGLRFAVTAETEIVGLDDEPLTLADLVVGETVEVEGYEDEAGTLIAETVEREDGFNRNGIVEATAALSLVQQNQVVLVGRAFRVLPPTEIVDAAGEPVDLSAFAAGDVVTVRARLVGNGQHLMALRIQGSSAPADSVTATGPLFSVDADAVEVLGASFVVDAATAIFDAEGDEIAIDALVPGQTVEVAAAVLADGSRLAGTVRIVGAVEGEGNVGGGSGSRGGSTSTFTLPGMTVSYDEHTLFRDPYDEVLDASSLQEGQRVKVVGESESDGTVSADRIVVYSTTTSTGLDPSVAPTADVVAQAYPNPTTGPVKVVFSLRTEAEVSVAVYDLLGREVLRTRPERVPAGRDHVVALDLGKAAAGMYLYRVEARARHTESATTGRISVVRNAAR